MEEDRKSCSEDEEYFPKNLGFDINCFKKEGDRGYCRICKCSVQWVTEWNLKTHSFSSKHKKNVMLKISKQSKDITKQKRNEDKSKDKNSEKLSGLSENIEYDLINLEKDEILKEKFQNEIHDLRNLLTIQEKEKDDKISQIETKLSTLSRTNDLMYFKIVAMAKELKKSEEKISVWFKVLSDIKTNMNIIQDTNNFILKNKSKLFFQMNELVSNAEKQKNEKKNSTWKNGYDEACFKEFMRSNKNNET